MKKKVILLLTTLFVTLASVFSCILFLSNEITPVRVRGANETTFVISEDDGQQLSSDTYQIKMVNGKGATLNINAVGVNFAENGSFGSTSNPDMYVYNTTPIRGIENISFSFNCDAHVFIVFSYNPINLADVMAGKYQDLFALSDIYCDEVSIPADYFSELRQSRYFMGFAYSLDGSFITINELNIEPVCADEPTEVPVGTNSGVLSTADISYINNTTNNCGVVASQVGNGAFCVNQYSEYFFTQCVEPDNTNIWSYNFIQNMTMNSPEALPGDSYKVKFTKNNDSIICVWSPGRYFELYSLKYQPISEVNLWLGYGAAYRSSLESFISSIRSDTQLSINLTHNSGAENLYHDIVDSISSGTYPDVACGYMNQFARYHGSNILRNLENLSNPTLNDYFSDYTQDNYLYDADGTAHLYSVPFTKSTEVLVYNGYFLDFCAEICNDSSLRTIPMTWSEWADTSSDSKVQKYLNCLNILTHSRQVWYATVNSGGTATNFSQTGGSGRTKIFDYRTSQHADGYLMCYDSLDNAFITAAKQLNIDYSCLPESERTKAPNKRTAEVKFMNTSNVNKTLDMLKFFRNLKTQYVFCNPAAFNSYYGSDAFNNGGCMFLVCSSASLQYLNNGGKVKIAPIPYFDASRKFVASQGFDLCLTNRQQYSDDSLELIKQMTTGSHVADLCINTGYFPGSKSVYNSSTYQSFLNTSSSDNTKEYKREAALVNFNTYTASNSWTKFIEESFIGATELRTIVGNIFNTVMNQNSISGDSAYLAIINNALADLPNTVIVDR